MKPLDKPPQARSIPVLSPTARRVLLLQGPPTPFFRVLHDAFTEAGVPVTRVLLHAGEGLRAGGRGIPFRGRLDEFEDFVEALMLDKGITDVLYFADRNPYHRIAERVAMRNGATPYAVEHGYLRPDWLTLEPGGMGAFSRFPVDRRTIEAIAADSPALDDRVLYRHGFATEAWYDVTYILMRLAGWPRYRWYDRDRDNHPIKEYLSWLPQLVRKKAAEWRAPRALDRFLADERPFFFLPLQLEEDYQIRKNSPYRCPRDLIEEVFASFASAAPEDTRLLIKVHPLDNGLADWPGLAKKAAKDFGLEGRVRVLAAGPLVPMIDRARGVVLVNSTVGMTSLRRHRPTKCLGVAVYDLPGLTDQSPLDAFWRNPTAPEPAYVDAFVRALARMTQLKGNLYEGEGMTVGAREIVRRVGAGYGASGVFVYPPPRLARARAIGVPLDTPVAFRHEAVEQAPRV